MTQCLPIESIGDNGSGGGGESSASGDGDSGGSGDSGGVFLWSILVILDASMLLSTFTFFLMVSAVDLLAVVWLRW